MLKAIPIRDYVAIKPDDAEEKQGMWDVAQTAQKKPKRGTVLAVGIGEFARDTGVLIPMTCKPGDRVWYSKFSGTEIEVNGEEIVLIREGECLLITDRQEEAGWLGTGELASKEAGV
jgi:chaperonin GroES